MRPQAVVAVAVMALAGGCGKDKPEKGLRVHISSWHLAAGHNYLYTIENDTLTVSERSDYAGGNIPKLVFFRKLTPRHAAALAGYVAAMPLAALEDSYEDPLNVFDGISMDFEIRPPGGATRKIAVRNIYQRDLVELAARIDKLVPKEYRTGYASPGARREDSSGKEGHDEE